VSCVAAGSAIARRSLAPAFVLTYAGARRNKNDAFSF
jgi:hypothetical protein